ncbi:hypothetical protein Tco_0396934 [Tanacetum coccineum]
MHNNIMAAGSRDRPPMLATGRYAQWQSCFMRYIDTRPNGEALKKCILQGPYKLSHIIIPCQPATDESPKVPKRTAVKTFSNISPENKAHYDAEKESIHLLLTRIGDEIYSTVDACKIAHDMFYKMMNEMVRNQLEVVTMQVNVQFLQQLQPEWSRFVTILKQTADLDKESYHKLFDILKQYQKEIAKPITHPSESASEEDNDPKQAQRDKDMQKKNLALIAKYFKNIYKPTNNNLRTSSNSRNKNVDTSPRQSGSAADGDTVLQLQGIWAFCSGVQKTKKGKILHLSQGKDVDVQGEDLNIKQPFE